MVRFLDGPAADVVLSLRRAPMFLRVVRSAQGEWDALDLLDDKPRHGEAIFAYQITGRPGIAHIDYLDKQGRRRGTTSMVAEYRVVPDPPDDAICRDNKLWGEWATARGKELQQA